jgi:hypothetical protein
VAGATKAGAGRAPRYWSIVGVILAAIAAIVAFQDLTSDSKLELAYEPPAPLLAVAGDGRALVRLDPFTLRVLPGRARLRGPPERWAPAPDRSRGVVVTGRGSTLQLLDLRRMRTLTALDTGARGAVAAVTWPRRDRVWLVLATPEARARGTTTVVTVDPIARRVIARRQLAARLTRVARAPDGPVLLLAPPSGIGPAEVATVDPRGEVDRIPLDDVSAGVQVTDRPPFILHRRTPALAVDPRGRRGYVSSVRPEVVEVDLRRGSVRSHLLSARRSLLDRLHDLVESRAEARPLLVGRERAAVWIPPDLIAVSGNDAHVLQHPGTAPEQDSVPVGLQIVETRRWRSQVVDEHVAGFRATAGLLLATGQGGWGLTAYRPDGRRAFDVLEGERVDIAATTGPLAYVRSAPASELHAVDLERGRVIASRASRGLRLVPTEGGPWD